MYTAVHKRIVAQALQAFKSGGVPAAMPYVQRLILSSMDRPIVLTVEGLQALLNTAEDVEDVEAIRGEASALSTHILEYVPGTPQISVDQAWAQLKQEPNEIWQELVTAKEELFKILSPCQVTARKATLVQQYLAWKAH